MHAILPAQVSGLALHSNCIDVAASKPAGASTIQQPREVSEPATDPNYEKKLLPFAELGSKNFRFWRSFSQLSNSRSSKVSKGKSRPDVSST